MPCPCRLRSCFRGAARRLEGHDGKQPRILGIGEINAESPSSFGSPRRDRLPCLQRSLRLGAVGSGQDAGTTRGRGMRVKAARIPPFRLREPCPPPFAPVFARIRLRIRCASGAPPMAFAECGCDSPRRRRSTTNLSPAIHKFGCWGAVFHLRFRGRFAPTPNARAFSSPWLHGGHAAGCGAETQMTGRLIRACSGRRLRRFGPAGRRKPDSAQSLAKPRPHLNPTLRLGADRKPS